MVAIGGSRPVDGALFYTNNRDYENVLLDVRARMLEGQNIRTRQTYHVVPRNFGNIEEEMFAEETSTVNTPNSNGGYTGNGGGNYVHAQGTPLFIEQQAANADRFIGLSATGSTTTTINIGTNAKDNYGLLYVGQKVEINGDTRVITAYTPATASTPASITLNSALSVAPGVGSQVLIKGRDFVNPYLTESYRVTDKFGSNIVDSNRYQVDRESGIIRYRPSQGSFNASSVWHPQNLQDVPYYFGKLISVKVPPPPAGPGPLDGSDGVTGNEILGSPTDTVDSGSVPTSTNPVAVAGIDPPLNAGQLDTAHITGYTLAAPDGQYSNISVETPPGVSFTVELNGAVLAVVSNGGKVVIPFFDPNPQNDQLKANESTDPDVYIQRFVKAGNNELVIKATRTAAAGGATGVRVEGLFNGVSLQTGADTLTNTGKPAAYNSVNSLDWSASRNSVLGIAGKIDYDLGDQTSLEDSNDEVQKMQGVLESLTTIIAGTDINQFQSILSVIR